MLINGIWNGFIEIIDNRIACDIFNIYDYLTGIAVEDCVCLFVSVYVAYVCIWGGGTAN